MRMIVKGAEDYFTSRSAPFGQVLLGFFGLLLFLLDLGANLFQWNTAAATGIFLSSHFHHLLFYGFICHLNRFLAERSILACKQ